MADKGYYAPHYARKLRKGRILHATLDTSLQATSLCNARPGKAGWLEQDYDQITCPRCQRKLEQIEERWERYMAGGGGNGGKTR